MKRKFFSVLFALVLVLSMSMIMAPPAMAATAVTGVWVEFPFTDDVNDNSNSTTNVYIVHFKATTALSRGVDYVTVTFPDGSSAMGGDGAIGGAYGFTVSAPAAVDVLFSTNYDTTDLITGAGWKRTTTTPIAGGYRVKTRLPIDIAAGQDVWVKFDDSNDSGAMTSAATEADTYKVYVATTKDTTPVLSSTFAIGDTGVADTDVSTSYPVPTTAGSTAEYIIEFTPAASVTGTSGKVTAKFPVGTTLPSSISATNVQFNTAAGSYSPCSETPVIDTDRRMITAIPSITLTGDAVATMKVLAGGGIINPTIADDSGDYYVAVRTSVDGHWDVADAVHEITYGSGTKVVVANGEIGKATERYSDDATMINMYSSQIWVVITDANGNGITPASTKTLTLSSSSATGTFARNSDAAGTATWTTGVTSTTIDATDSYDPNANPDTQMFYYKDSTAGTHTLTFSVSGYTAAEWTVTVCPGVSVYDVSNNLVATYAATSSTPVSETDDGSTYTQKYSGEYINDAIDGAMAGDTVKLGDGIYELDTAISLDKKVTLTSVNGASSTTLRNTATINKAIWVNITGTAANPIIIDGLTIERLRYGTEIRNAVYSWTYDYVTVRNCTFNYIMPDDVMDAKEGVVAILNHGGSSNLESITISNNTFNYCCTNLWPYLGATDSSADQAWNWAANINVISATSTKTVKGVDITGNTLNNCDGYAIAVKGAGTSTTVTGSVTNNTITNGFFAICLGPDTSTDGFSITGNTITGAYDGGIEIEGSSHGNVTVKNNSITGSAVVNSGCAVRVYDAPVISGTYYTHYIQYNDIYDNASDIYAIKVTDDSSVTGGITLARVDCRYNWFGDASGPAYTAVTGATVTKSNPNGLGDAITDRVFYYPWLYTSKATVVADNASYQASTMKLVSGWNTLSTPVQLIAAADAVDELIPSGMTVGYYYDATATVPGWQQITTGKVLSPCDAVYVKMSAATDVLLKFDAGAFTTPSKDLAAGWNLMSLAYLASAGKTDMATVASVAKTAANMPGYSQLVSPSLNATQTNMFGVAGTSWAYAYGQSDGSGGTCFAGLGYWCYMQNAATLAGFEITPIAPDLD